MAGASALCAPSHRLRARRSARMGRFSERHASDSWVSCRSCGPVTGGPEVPDLFAAIDRAWLDLTRSAQATNIHRLWTERHPLLRAHVDLDEIAAAAQ